MNLEDAANQLEAIGNPTRLNLYRLLVRTGDTGMSVGSMQDKLSIPGSTLSHHLKKLVDVGLVDQERRSTTLLCRANFRAMSELVSYLVDECCADLPQD